MADATQVIKPPQIPDHEVLHLVGRGSYGEVWLARNVMGTHRAVKVVRRATFAEDRPFEREFDGIRRYEPISRSHPGCVCILHIGRRDDAGYFYYVMELADDAGAEVPGTGSCGSSSPEASQRETRCPTLETYAPRTLAGELRRRARLPVPECVRLGTQLADALAHLHRHGLVHRDIKPANIIFVNRAAKLADIGLVTEADASATLIGTLPYIPPEGPGKPSADVYALGRVLYEISTGLRPERFPELPADLRDWPDAKLFLRFNEVVLLRATDPDQRRRFPSADELRDALAAAGKTSGPTGRPVRPPAHPGALTSNEQRGAGGAVEAPVQRGRRVVVLNTSAVPEAAALVAALAERLVADGGEVFIDDAAGLSVDWARELEREIRRADAVIALLAPAAVAHEMFAYGLEVAAQAARQNRGRPRLLPVRVAYDGALPLPFHVGSPAGTALRWTGDDRRLANELMAALQRQAEQSSPRPAD